MIAQSVTCQPWSPCAQRFARRLLDRPEERIRHRAELDVEPELDARRRLDAQADGREERVRVLVHELERSARAGRPLDADRRALAERDRDAEVARERRLDHLLLHLAVERDGELAVLAHADQRVLLGELRERDAQRAAVGGAARDDDRLERRRGEVTGRGDRRTAADRVADPHVGEPAEHPDPPRHERVAPHRRALLEHVDRGDLALREPVAGAQLAREQPHVRDLLAARRALDLEHRAGDRAAGRMLGGEQLREAGDQVVDAGARAGGAEEHRVHERPAGLRRQRAAEVGAGAAVDVRGEQRVVVLGEHLERARRDARPEPRRAACRAPRPTPSARSPA